MAYYLVRARPRRDTLPALRDDLEAGRIRELEPFGRSLEKSLKGARVDESGQAIWEELDYCSPPLAMERAAVLDRHFADISVEVVERGDGWAAIDRLPSLWEGEPGA